jgi:hypothetical protein
MRRTILAVVLGYVLWSGLWVALGQILVTIKPDLFLEDGSAAGSGVHFVFLVYSVVLSLLAGMVAALIAYPKPMTAACILAGALLLTGLGVEIASWSLAPAWYHIVFLALLVPATCGGARLAPKRV